MRDEEILAFIASHDDPVVTTSEVAEFLDFSNHGAMKRLRRLGDAGELASKLVGRSPVWWITESGQDRLDDDTSR